MTLGAATLILVALGGTARAQVPGCTPSLLDSYSKAWSKDSDIGQVSVAVKANGYQKHGDNGGGVLSRDQLVENIQATRNAGIGADRIQGVENLTVTVVASALLKDVCVVQWKATGSHTRVDDKGVAHPNLAVNLEGVTALRLDGGKIQSEQVLSSNDDQVLHDLGYK